MAMNFKTDAFSFDGVFNNDYLEEAVRSVSYDDDINIAVILNDEISIIIGNSAGGCDDILTISNIDESSAEALGNALLFYAKQLKFQKE